MRTGSTEPVPSVGGGNRRRRSTKRYRYWSTTRLCSPATSSRRVAALPGGLEHILLLAGADTEGWVIAKSAAAFDAALVDLERQIFLWTAEYTSLAGAKRGVIAAGKRLEVIPAGGEQDPALAAIDEPGQSPKSIWEWDDEIFSYATWIEVDGLGIDGVVTPLKDGSFEGDVVVGKYVFREEYPDEWSAKRGVLIRAGALVEQAVAV